MARCLPVELRYFLYGDAYRLARIASAYLQCVAETPELERGVRDNGTAKEWEAEEQRWGEIEKEMEAEK